MGTVYSIDELDGIIDDDDYSFSNYYVLDTDYFKDIPSEISDCFENYEKIEFEELPSFIKEEIDSHRKTIGGELKPILEIWEVSDEMRGFFTTETKYIVVLENTNRFKDSEFDYIQFSDSEFLAKKEGFYDEIEMENLFITRDSIYDSFYESQWDYLKEVEEEIDFNSGINRRTEDIISDIFYSDNTKAIIRRYFRYNDVLVNNTKIDTKSKRYKYIKDSLFDNYQSISKNPITDNAKRLITIFDEFRGWTIKNAEKLKEISKKTRNLFSDEELVLLNNIKNNIDKISSYIYDNDFINTVIENKSKGIKTVDFVFDDIRFQTSETIKIYNDLKKTFSKIDSEVVLNYLKRLPNIKGIDILLDNKDHFNDIFIEKFIEEFNNWNDFYEKIREIEKDKKMIFNTD
jgi:hypothetical protein